MSARVSLLAVLLAVPAGLVAQAVNDPGNSLRNPHVGGSTNIKVVGHIGLGYYRTVADVEIEQELSRPYAYMPRRDMLPGQPGPSTIVGVKQFTNASKGVDIISLKDPARPVVIYSWRIPNQELHRTGGMDNKYFKLKGRYYDVQSLQFGGEGPDADVGAAVLDVTSLPDTTRVRLVGLIKTPDVTGGFHNMFAYKHSDGRTLLFTTNGNPGARVYDMEKFVAGAADQGMLGRVPVPEQPGGARRGGGSYHDMYVGYDPAKKRDLFYGAGSGGYYVYDVTKPEDAQLVASVTGVSGVNGGHTFTPDPTGRYAVTETEYQYTPLRLFDLKPALDGEVKNIARPVGAWLGSWDGNSHNHEVRWPYVFVSGYVDGLQVFNMMDPTNPYTVGYYYTCNCTLPAGKDGAGQAGGMDGAFGVDVRNADGLIVVSDKQTGFWTFKMEGFDGWNGHQWGMPNVSSVQDWDNGPDGAPRPQRVS